MPIKLSPKNGVPTGEMLDTFHRTTNQLGVDVHVFEQPNQPLPTINSNAYKQLLNTIASIVHDPLGFMKGITTIALFPSWFVNAGMTYNNILVYESPFTHSGASILDDMQEVVLKELAQKSLSNQATIAEHEGIHNFLRNTARHLMGLNPKIMSFDDKLAVKDLNDTVLQNYIDKLSFKNTPLMAEAPSILTDYYKNQGGRDYNTSEEFFTTLFEAYASEVASRTPITEEMAYAVGSTVDNLEARKQALLPTVSESQRTILKDLLSLIRDTPLDLEDWVLYNHIDVDMQYHLLSQLSPNFPLLEAEKLLKNFYPFDKKKLLQKSLAVLRIPLDVPQQFIHLLDSIDEKELMITMLHRLV
ncbi:MAG: hypothetical protein H2174_06185 [Vampirovibrio sp.]|nr:hypothetical protein [Vampirovibrio sp.]